MNEQNPYDAPEQKESIQANALEGFGPQCPKCGSFRTSSDKLFGERPNIAWFFVFGWFYFLLQAAFKSKELFCNDCEESTKYRTTSSWVCLTIVIVLAGLITFRVLTVE